MDVPDRPWQNLCPRPKHAKPANHSIGPGAKESHFARPEGDQLCLAFVRGTCLVLVQWREHPNYMLAPPLGRGRLARKHAEPPQHEHVQSQPVRGASPTRSTRGLARSEFAVRDSTCRRFPGLFLSKRLLDSTRRLGARVSMLQRDAPARSTADHSRCPRL